VAGTFYILIGLTSDAGASLHRSKMGGDDESHALWRANEGCDFVARGATEDEVMKKAAEHAKAAHGIDNITPELAQKVKAAIKNE
jgi:predicted small metal-binding protein